MNIEKKDNLKSGERRIVTVLFSDMKGFTNLSERSDPEEMDALMTRIFSLFESIITLYEGIVEKYIGDALVAVFGAPRIHEDDPSRAVHAALDFMAGILKLNAELKDKNVVLGFRTGIHMGLITTGKRGKFDVVTGSTMNIASRLQEAASSNTILVSEDVKGQCESDFIFSQPADLPIRGMDEKIIVYRVERRNPELLSGGDNFTGHDALLDEMVKSYLRHNSGKPGVCMLTGEPGIGKNEVAGRFLRKLNQFPGFTSPILHAKAQSYRPVPFSVILDLITDYFGIDAAGAPEAIAGRLMSVYGIDSETADGLSRLIRNMSESRVVDKAFLILHRLLQSAFSAAGEGPYPPVVYVDNIHDADSASRDFLRYLLEADGIKPFFLFTGREIPAGLREIFKDYPVRELEPLTAEESSELIRKLWPECTDEETFRMILNNSLGNPLFIREYVKLAKDSSDISGLPATIQNIFLMSLEKYPEGTKNLLKKMSVFFLSFTVENARYIERKTDGKPDEVPAMLDRLAADGILEQNGLYYSFRHDVFKKAVYNSLLNYNKKILHKLVAALLMETEKPHLPRLLQHLLRSEDFETARSVLLQKTGRFYSTEYLTFIDSILENTGKDDYTAIIECLFLKSLILFNNGKTEAMDSILKQILRIAVSTRNFEYAARAYHLLAAYNVNAYAFQKALFCGTKAIYYYRKMPDRKRAIYDLLRILSLSELLRNDVSRSADFISQMEGGNDPDLESIRFNALMDRHLLLGEYTEALKYMPIDHREHDDESEDLWFFLRFTVTKLYMQMCDYNNLGSLARKMLRIGTKHFSILSQIQAQLAVCRHVAGDAEASAESFAQAELYLTQIRNDFDCIDALRTLSCCYYLTGNIARAEETASDGVVKGLRHSSCFPVFTLLILLAEISMKKGQRQEAGFIMDEAVFYIDLGVLLSRKDLIIYYYIKSQLENDDVLLSRAGELLAEEKKAIADEKLVEAFMATRSFSEIEQAACERINRS